MRSREPDVRAFLSHLLAAGTTRRRLQGGETLFREGEPSTGFHAVVHGRIALVLVLHVAKETVFAELERNPGFARRVIAALSAKLHATVRELDAEHLSRILRELALAGLIAVDGRKVGIPDVGRLRDWLGKDQELQKT